ncbi:E3 ubiquitin-protein ligase [Porphyridium purpureum]|uniref:E3 ubiquitin-protein ligase n=1 Tax=Porphyridium purpureum TaxID=35688 RepID=A0A5J4YYZ4_PORPP|nr:E3 ubiquitin-protein ligase [Porphyridium purpureum]|eukprot:POR8869..scf208_2
MMASYFDDHDVADVAMGSGSRPGSAGEQAGAAANQLAEFFALLGSSSDDASIRARTVTLLAELAQLAGTHVNLAETLSNPPAAESAIAELPRLAPAELRVVAPAETCPVCTCELAQQDCLKMPCAHLFHAECLMAWLHRHNSCPCCRRELRTDDIQYENKKRERARQQAAKAMYDSMYN